MADATSSRPRTTLTGVLALLAPCLAVCGWLLCPGVSYRNPPIIYSSWYIGGGLQVLAVVLAFHAAGHPPRRRAWWVASFITLIVAVPALCGPIFSYYYSFNDFPWLVVLPLLALLIIGGWRYRHKWLAIGTVALILFLVVTALLPPAPRPLPWTRTRNGLSVEMVSVQRNQPVYWPGFVLTDRRGKRPEDEYDVRHAQLHGWICGILPVECWSPHVRPGEDELPANQLLLVGWTFPPSWSRTVNFQLEISAWPKTPAASLVIPVPPPGPRHLLTKPLVSRGRELDLTARNVRWTKSEGFPSHPAVSVDVTCEDYSPRKTQWFPPCQLRAIDNDGHAIPVHTSGLTGGVMECEIYPLPKGAHSLTLQAFTHDQMRQSRLEFRFLRLPNRGKRVLSW